MKRYIALLMLAVFAITVWGATCPTVRRVYAQETEPAKEKVRLQWKWEKGKTYRYKMTQEMKQKMLGAPQGDMETSMNQVMVLSQKVTEMDEQGVATIEFKYESIKVEMDNPIIGKMSFDSTKEEDLKKAKENPQFAPFAIMAGKSFIIRMSKDGKVVEVKGYSKLMEELFKEQEDNPMLDQLKDAFSDESMKKMMQQSYAQFPKEGVAIGDSWETSMEMPMPPLMTIKTKGKNTYKGNETVGGRECARIDTQMEMTISMDPESPFIKMFDMEWESISGTSVVYFDPQEGVTIETEAKIGMKGTLTSKMGEDEEEGEEIEKIEMKMEQEMTMRTELVE